MIQNRIKEIKVAMGIYGGDRVYGLLAEFSDPGALLRAAREVHRAGYKHFDVHSPFPIHGMDRAMGLGNSKVGIMALAGGITGFALGWWMQWWMGAADYPLNISGKPFFSFEPSIPIMFELAVLFSAFGAVIGMFLINGLPRHYHPLFYSKNFTRATDDAFFLHIAASDQLFQPERTTKLLHDLGGTNIEVIEDTGVVEVEC